MSFRLAGVHPAVRERAEWAVRYASQYIEPPRITSGYRSLERQAQLRRDWERGRSRWPANRPGDSSHNFGLAFDSVLPDRWKGNPDAEAWWRAVREYAGFHIPANDSIHAEVPDWRRVV